MVISNHRSILDPMVVGFSVDRFINFAAASYSFKNAVQERGWPVSLSIGLVTFTRPPDSVGEMIKAADALM